MPKVKFETNLGDITLELDQEKAPKTVANFLHYVNSGFYNGVIFHRVIPGFMVQGGGFTQEFEQKDGEEPIENEANNGLKNDKGTIAMARTADPHSASSQFFINQANNDFLNFTAPTTQGWGYAVFGKVIEGIEVVDRMAEQKTHNKQGHADVPVENIVIQKAEVLANE